MKTLSGLWPSGTSHRNNPYGHITEEAYEGNRLLIPTRHSIRHNKKFSFNMLTLRKYARDHQLFAVSHVMT